MSYFIRLIVIFLISYEVHASRAALMIIDMQKNFIERSGTFVTSENQEKLRKVLDRQVELIKIARETNSVIIHVEFIGNGETHPRLLDALRGYNKILFMTKSSNDLFAESSMMLEGIILKLKGIKNLIVAGANGDACVRDTVTTASFYRGFNTLIDTMGTIDMNYDDFFYPYNNGALSGFRYTKFTKDLKFIKKVFKDNRQNVHERQSCLRARYKFLLGATLSYAAYDFFKNEDEEKEKKERDQ